MDLTVKDIAKRLKVSEKTIYRMIKGEAIPCFRVGGQWRFHEGEILSWLEDAKEVTKSFREEKHHGSEEAISVADFLRRGGIYCRIAGDSRETVIRESLHAIKPGLPSEEMTRLFTAPSWKGKTFAPPESGMAWPCPIPGDSRIFPTPFPLPSDNISPDRETKNEITQISFHFHSGFWLFWCLLGLRRPNKHQKLPLIKKPQKSKFLYSFSL